MEKKWSLDALYESFDSGKYKDDLDGMKSEIEHIKQWAEDNLNDISDPVRKMEDYIRIENSFAKYSGLVQYCSLTLSVETLNEKAAKNLDVLEELLTELSKPTVMFQSFIGRLDCLEDLISSSELLQCHAFFLRDIKEECKYMLSEQEEIVLAKLKNTGSNLWTKLRDQITSTLLVDIHMDGADKKLPLTVIRNYAYEKDGALRKKAYEAELRSYEKIDKSTSFALNGIKGEVLTVSKLRGYTSPLDMTLLDSRMDRETLDAMLSAMVDYLPIFRKYLRKKAELLGHKNGLPFYDLFAPLGEINMTFSYEEAAQFVIKNFTDFSQKLGDYATKAFSEGWIDAEPGEGKQGGAFCDNLHYLKQSRIMTNFTGSFSDVLTLAHELGHGYHGECLNDETYLNSDYPMPIAETASTFCETIVCNAALKTASKEEAFIILENNIMEITQVIVDIYSRFLFEEQVFKNRVDGTLSVGELKEFMLNAQKQSYGDGLDENFLHPYMWICKPHYYSADFNYYNFPYAYGQLFSKGLYARYSADPEDFIEKYDLLLAATGKNNLYDVAKLMDIDVRSKAFWESSLKLAAEEIEKFIAM